MNRLYKRLLESVPSEQRRKIEFLLADPQLGEEIIGCSGVVNNTDSAKNIRSNCFGTALWVINKFPTGESLRDDIGFPLFFPGKNRPGYVDWRIIQEEVTKLKESIMMIFPGDLVIFEKHQSSPNLENPNQRIFHAGVFAQGGYFFHQRKYGGIFEFHRLDDYFQETYIARGYSPRE